MTRMLVFPALLSLINLLSDFVLDDPSQRKMRVGFSLWAVRGSSLPLPARVAGARRPVLGIVCVYRQQTQPYLSLEIDVRAGSTAER